MSASKPTTLGRVDSAIIAIVGPLVVLQIGLAVLALRDLARPERRVRGPGKLVWGAIIVFGELLGPIVYFMFGRQEDEA
jgi:phospholipase D-like protein